MTEPVTIGRNEPCPCGSGKKYKRCCGVHAAPKLMTPKPAADLGLGQDLSGMDSEAGSQMPPQMDPQMMLKISQALQRLPKGQVQRLQAIMQKAMNGKDVTREAQEFEKTLPVEFQNLIRSFATPEAAPNAVNEAELAPPEMTVPEMTIEEARALVAKAAEEGKLSAEQAENLLDHESSADSSSKLSRFWRNLSGKNSEKSHS